MLVCNNWTEQVVPDAGSGERNDGAERVCSFMGGATVTIGQNPENLTGTGPHARVQMEGTMALPHMCLRMALLNISERSDASALGDSMSQY